jgi:hypothetical protein
LVHCGAFVIVGVHGINVGPLLPFLGAVVGEVPFFSTVKALAIDTAILSLVVHLGDVSLGAPVILVSAVVIPTVLVVGGARAAQVHWHSSGIVVAAVRVRRVSVPWLVPLVRLIPLWAWVSSECLIDSLIGVWVFLFAGGRDSLYYFLCVDRLHCLFPDGLEAS